MRLRRSRYRLCPRKNNIKKGERELSFFDVIGFILILILLGRFDFILPAYGNTISNIAF